VGEEIAVPDDILMKKEASTEVVTLPVPGVEHNEERKEEHRNQEEEHRNTK
jgi:hypothetical protein